MCDRTSHRPKPDYSETKWCRYVHALYFYKQVCLRPQGHICLREFLVTGSKHAYNMLVSKRIKFNWAAQPWFFSIYTNETYHFSWSVEWKVLLLNQARNLLRRKGSQFELACLFWLVVCNIQSCLDGYSWIMQLYQATIEKVCTFKITTFWSYHFPFTREYASEVTLIDFLSMVISSLPRWRHFKWPLYFLEFRTS